MKHIKLARLGLLYGAGRCAAVGGPPEGAYQPPVVEDSDAFDTSAAGKVTIKSGYTPANTRLQRSNDGDDLYIVLLDENGAAIDSLTVADYYVKDSAPIQSVAFADDDTVWGAADFALAPLTGGENVDWLRGKKHASDVFDTAGGKTDILYGYSGDDVYWLGAGTGVDLVFEQMGNSGGGDAGDKIRIKSGYTPENTRLRRTDNHLFVELLDEDGAVTDYMQVWGHYAKKSAKVESVEFEDSDTVWDADDLAAARWRGTGRSESIYGTGKADVFDSDAGGNDFLLGGGGNDVYWLGAGTDHDVIKEYKGAGLWKTAGGSSDKIKIKSGYGAADVRLLRSSKDLLVQLLNDSGQVTDSLRVSEYYRYASAKVESVEFTDGSGTVWDAAALTAAGEIKGTAGADTMAGKQNSNDVLLGGGGDDVYTLAAGSGHDVIREYAGNTGDDGDKIRISGAPAGARLLKSEDGKNLIVQLLNDSGEVTDSLTVQHHFTDASAKVESIEFSDGTIWNADILNMKEITGGEGDDSLYGTILTDIFDADAGGNDTLRGGAGGDVYLFGGGTGNDIIDEAYRNLGSAADAIRLKAGVKTSSVALSRTASDLILSLTDSAGAVTDTLTVKGYYVSDAAKIERIEQSDGALLWGSEELTETAMYTDASAGDDDVEGSAAEETLGGFGGGNDTLRGGAGGDVYLFGSGSGNDIIDEGFRNFGSAADAVRLSAGVKAANVMLSRDASDLILSLTDSEGAVTDTLTVKDYYVNDAAKIERVEMNDGALLWGADDFAKAVYADSSAGDDIVDGSAAAETLSGYGGGNDTLRGGAGGDVYLFGGGSGNDVIDESFRNFGGGIDKVRLKAGVTASAVMLSRTASDLLIMLKNSEGAVTDSLTVKNYYVNDAAKIELVELNDGTAVWTQSQLNAAAHADASAGDDDVRGSAAAETLSGYGGGNDTLRGGGGDDVYLFGGGSGNDIIDEGFRNFGSAADAVRLKAGVTSSDVALSRNAFNLIISLKNSEGAVTDTLTVKDYYVSAAAKIERVELSGGALLWGKADFAAVTWTAPVYAAGSGEITGGAGNDSLYGKAGVNDVFDSDGGGKDALYGYSGNDVYWLGAGTNRDTIYEADSGGGAGDAGDMIKIKSSHAPGSARLLRSNDGDDLIVQLLNAKGLVTDSLTVADHYTDDSAKIESVVFDDGTVWDATRFALAEITGGASNESLHGEADLNDVFDSRGGGNDTLLGYGGDDVYWLGAGTAHDVIREYSGNSGDANDLIKIRSSHAPGNVNLLRSNDGDDLIVRLLKDGLVTDSLTVEDYYAKDSAKIEGVVFDDGTVWGADRFALAKITGGAGADSLYGEADVNDVFDSGAGGNDTLYGYGGDDVYWLGAGTNHDVIREDFGGSGDAKDLIKIKSSHAPGNVNLLRSDDGNDLIVRLLKDGLVTDSLTVRNHYADDAAKIEGVVFDDGTVWDATRFALAEITGGAGADSLYGNADLNDVFDSRGGGNDTLLGYGGDDVYWLGAGTDHDVIREYSGNSGDADDRIKIRSGIASGSVNLLRSDDGNDLIVRLLNAKGLVTDSLTVEDYYADDSAKIEGVEFTGGAMWGATDFAQARITGGAGGDNLYGKADLNDVFDSDGGGDDDLYGYGGDDVYWLGAGTDHDVIHEDDGNSGDDDDMIRIKSGYLSSDVHLVRAGADLIVQLLNAKGLAADSLTVDDYYTKAAAKIERLEFANGAVWDATHFALAQITGGASNESLHGEADAKDVFDSDGGGNDTLYGYGGNDVYWLGAGTDHDVIREDFGNSGDANDLIKIKSGYAPGSVHLVRAGADMVVQLLNAKGLAADSLTVRHYFTDKSAKIERLEFANGTVWDATHFTLAQITGGAGSENLYGEADVNDVFDSDGGGNDALRGYSGDDVYWLGAGTNHDTIYEHDGNTGDADDRINIKSGVAPGSVNLLRSNDGNDLLVQLLNDKGLVTDSLTVDDYYVKAAARIEIVAFEDSGTVWDATHFALAQITGGAGVDNLHGKADLNDVFDSDGGGNDALYGYGGDDVYWLGAGTDHDTIYEHNGNSGDADDRIKIKSGIALASVRLQHSGNDLVIGLLDDNGAVTDSLTVQHHFTKAAAEIESIEAAGHVLRENQFQALIDEIAAFTAGTSSYDSLSDIYDHYWEDSSALAPSSS